MYSTTRGSLKECVIKAFEFFHRGLEGRIVIVANHKSKYYMIKTWSEWADMRDLSETQGLVAVLNASVGELRNILSVNQDQYSFLLGHRDEEKDSGK